MRVSPFGYLRIEAYLQLPVAFRSLSRPSSAPDAKAFTLCSSSLELSYSWFSFFLNCLSFIKQIIDSVINSFCEKVLSFFFELFSTFRWNCNLPKLERPWFLLISISFNLCPLICSFLTLQYFIRFSMNTYFSYLSVSWWAQVDSNHRPRAYQARALTTWAMSPR